MAKRGRVKEAQEKAAKVRIEVQSLWKLTLLKEKVTRATKNELIDTSGSEGEGVMDNLMEALKNGSAFSRDQKRKRSRATGGDLISNMLWWIINNVAAKRRQELDRNRSRGVVGSTNNVDIV